MRTVKVDNGYPICQLQETKSDLPFSYFSCPWILCYGGVTESRLCELFSSCQLNDSYICCSWLKPTPETLFIAEANGHEEYGQVLGFWRFLGIPENRVKRRGMISGEVFGGMTSG